MTGRARITPHFAAKEFDCHDGTPFPEAVRPHLTDLSVRFLEPLRVEFGPVTIVSGYRTQRWNHKVGGAPASRHLYDSFPLEPAVDLTCSRGTPREWFRWLDKKHPGGLGLYVAHVHVDNRRRHARW